MKNLAKIIAVILLIALFPGFAGFLFLICAFLSKGKKAYYFLFISCLLIGLVFLDLIPGTGLDVDRYMQMTSQLRYMQIHNFRELLNYFQNSAENERSNYLFIIIQYVVSRFKYANLLSYFSVFTSSVFCLFPFVDIVQKCNKYHVFGLLLSLIAYYILGFGYMASVMRWSLAVTSSVFVDYLYFIRLRANKKYLPILFIPLLFHMGIVLGVIMALFVVFKKHIRLFDVMFFVVICSVLLLVSSYGSSSRGFMGQLLNTTNIYSTNFLASGMTINAAILNWIIYSVYFVLILLDLLIHKVNKDSRNPFASLSILCIVSTVLLSTRYLILVRFIPLACFYLTVDILLTLSLSKNVIKLNRGMGLLISVITIIDFIVANFVGFVSFRQLAFPVSGLNIWFCSIYYLMSNAILF